VKHNFSMDEEDGLTYGSWQPERRHRKQQPNRKTRRQEKPALEEIAETRDMEGGLRISYQPARFEEGWLESALKPFFDLTFITDVLARVKGGKEASVYRCLAHETVGAPWLAAKVYRPRMFRNLWRDHLYREGRDLIDQDGKAIKGNDTRVQRAVHRSSAFGQQVRHTSWLSYEFKLLRQLHSTGADVPQPVAMGENALLLSFVGDERRAAPTLSEVALDADEARYMYDRVLENVELMLKQGVVHGDLSAYNILYWQGEIVIIDFPQAVNPHDNRSARSFFERDVERVCDYFQKQGLRCDGRAVARKLWRKYHDDAVPIDYDLHNE